MAWRNVVERQEHQNDDGGGGDEEYNDDDIEEYHKDESCESELVFGDDEGVIMWVG